MLKRQLDVKELESVGPYSVGIQVGPTVFVSGQLPLNEKGDLVSQDLSCQTRKVIENIEKVLKEANMSLENVVKTTVYVTNLDDFRQINQTYAIYFAHPYPARSCIEVSNLPHNAKVKIDCVAVEAETAHEEDCSGCCCGDE